MADNKAFQKKANIALVMQTVRVKNKISRIDISRELGLDRSTITNIVSKLIEGELLIELAEGSSVPKGGRKPVLLGVNRKFGLVLGLEIQREEYFSTLMAIDGSTIWNRCGKIPDGVNLSHCVKAIYRELKNDIDREDSPLIGIGIGLSGHIDPLESRVMDLSPYVREAGYRDDFSTLFRFPVILDNNANCCAWGVLEEWKDRGIKNFLYSILETAADRSNEIGFGIVVNGHVYYGNNYAAGDLLNSIPCNGDDYREYFIELIDKLNLFVSFLNPGYLFLGNKFLEHRELLEELFSLYPLKCEVVFSRRGSYAASFGAASMFIERLFKVPVVDNIRDMELTWEKILNSRKVLKK